VTALIQYLLLAAFCWMMCEGVMLYLKLAVMISSLSEKRWFFCLLGWGMYVTRAPVCTGPVNGKYIIFVILTVIR